MRKPAANSPTDPIQSSAFPKDESQRLFLSSRYRTSQLVEALKPFGELAFPDAPLAADFESRQFLVLDHAVHCSLRHLQQLSGFLKRQQAERLLKVILRRSFHASEIEQRQCHDASKCGRPFLGKRSRAAFRLVRQESISGERATISKRKSKPTIGHVEFIDKHIRCDEKAICPLSCITDARSY